MTKLKYSNCIDSCKKMKLKDSKGVIEVKSTNSFLAHLLFIAKSNRDIDLEEVISNYEFSATNSLIMQPVGSIIMELIKVSCYIFLQISHQKAVVKNLEP